MLAAVGYWLVPQFVSPENAAVEWALRLPQERKRARAAGFIGTKRVMPKVDPQTDAGADWVRLDAQMRANAPDDKLPNYGMIGNYINPITRRTVKRSIAMEILRRYEPFLKDADRAGRKPNCTFAFRAGKQDRDGEYAPTCLAVLHLVAAVETRDAGKEDVSLQHVLSALRIARQSQTQDTWYGISAGLRTEQLLLRFVRDGFTDFDAGKRTRWAKSCKPFEPFLLRKTPNETAPADQMRGAFTDDYLQTEEMVGAWRTKRYKLPKTDFTYPMPPFIATLNELDYRLRNKLELDSFQAVNLYGVTGASLRLYSFSLNTRPYAVWQSLSQWDKHLTRQTKDAPRWLQDWNWSGLLRRRLERDTDRALTQAVYNHVTGGKNPLPEDPFAPKAGTRIQRHNLPGGMVLWYSVGINGKDDGGDFQKDRTFRLLPTK